VCLDKTTVSSKLPRDQEVIYLAVYNTESAAIHAREKFDGFGLFSERLIVTIHVHSFYFVLHA